MFGPLTEERNRWLLAGVVAGIGGYGNCIGVPTVGGEIHFAQAHSANPAVNVMCVGIASADRLVTAESLAVHEGSLMVLYGAATGRDGIGGVSVLASATLEEGSEDSAASRPSVQIGDPFAEKLLIEASLEMIERRPAGGPAGSGRGRHHVRGERVGRARRDGAVLELDLVPLREPGMEPFEILTSESQERMLAIVSPERLVEVQEVCDRWGLASTPIASLVPGRTLRVQVGGEVVAEIPAPSLAEEGPVYERPMSPIEPAADDDPTFVPYDGDLREAFLAVLGSPNVASKRWVFEQYDSIVQGQTVASAGGDAAIVRIPGTLKAVALSADGKGRFGAPRSLSRRGARRRRGRPQRRGDRREAARDHELHELREPGASRGDVAVRRGDPRDARRVPGVRDPGHRRQRELLQRVRRLGDLADTGDRHARSAGGPSAARAGRVRTAGPGDLPAGRDVPRARWLGVRRGPAGPDRRQAAGAGHGQGA